MKRWLKELIASFAFNTGDIAIILCSDDYLLDINKQYLNHDYFTDIITFDYSTSGYISGDLLVSIDRIKENSVTLGVSVDNELHRVIAHGILHLCGFKDKSNEEQTRMRKEEDKALSKLKELIISH